MSRNEARGNTRAPRGSRLSFVLACPASLLLFALACGSSPSPAPTAPSPAPGTQPPGGGCGVIGGGSFSASILNGTECSAASSSVVLLNMRAADGFGVGSCSGTVIASRAILTAAHCLADEVATVRVWLGSGPEIVADSFVPHPGYSGSGASPLDVGLVFVGQDLGRTPIPLLLSRDARVGETAVVAGWGRDLSSVPSTLRAGVTTITGVSSTHLETQFGTNVGSVCSGDSGGPIFLFEGGTWAIAGVISATSESVCHTGTNFYVALRNPAISSFVLERVPDAQRR